MSHKRELKAELQLSTPELIHHLEAIVAGLRDGHVKLEQGDRAVSLHPGAAVTLEIEVKQKRDRERLSLEISWARPQEPEETTPGPLRISSGRG